MEFTAESIAAIVVLLISLALEVVPGLTKLWDGVVKEYKPLIILGLCVLTPVAVVGLGCLGVDFGYGQVCPAPNSPQMWVDAVLLGFGAFVLSQVGFQYVGAPLGARVKEADPKA